MSDAFNNYCIACDQLCSPNSVYCLTTCRERDEHPLASSLKCSDIVSPLLTPSLYQLSAESDSASDVGSSLLTTSELNNSPLLLATDLKEADVRDLNLNYLVSQSQPLLGPLALTSHNYRLWLGVLWRGWHHLGTHKKKKKIWKKHDQKKSKNLTTTKIFTNQKIIYHQVYSIFGSWYR